MEEGWKCHKFGDTEFYTDTRGVVREILQDGKPICEFSSKIIKQMKQVEADELRERHFGD